MKKLNLNKQEVLKLSTAQQGAILGGGPKRSERLKGDCAYSRNHPVSNIITNNQYCQPKGYEEYEPH